MDARALPVGKTFTAPGNDFFNEPIVKPDVIMSAEDLLVPLVVVTVVVLVNVTLVVVLTLDKPEFNLILLLVSESLLKSSRFNKADADTEMN